MLLSVKFSYIYTELLKKKMFLFILLMFIKFAKIRIGMQYFFAFCLFDFLTNCFILYYTHQLFLHLFVLEKCGTVCSPVTMRYAGFEPGTASSGQCGTKKKDKDRRKGKGRRFCLGARIY